MTPNILGSEERPLPSGKVGDARLIFIVSKSDTTADMFGPAWKKAAWFGKKFSSEEPREIVANLLGEKVEPEELLDLFTASSNTDIESPIRKSAGPKAITSSSVTNQ